MKKGFTLIEMLVVTIILALVTTLGYEGVKAFNRNIKKNLWEEKITIIEKAGIDYGTDNKNFLTGSCTVDDKTYNYCKRITVDELITKGYLSTKETDEEGKKVITNDTKEEDEAGYYANNLVVNVYLKNNIVYAKLVN